MHSLKFTDYRLNQYIHVCAMLAGALRTVIMIRILGNSLQDIGSFAEIPLHIVMMFWHEISSIPYLAVPTLMATELFNINI